MSSRSQSRREFLRLAAIGAAGVTLAACGPTPSPAAPEAKPTEVAPTEAPEPTVPAVGKGVTLQYYIGFGAGGNPDQVEAVQKIFDRYVAASGGKVSAVEPLVVPWA